MIYFVVVLLIGLFSIFSYAYGYARGQQSYSDKIEDQMWNLFDHVDKQHEPLVNDIYKHLTNFGEINLIAIKKKHGKTKKLK